MYNLIIIFMITMIITNLVMILNIYFSKKMYLNREKNSPFECGFNPKNIKRMPFSIQFFIIAMIFLVFDIEISILLPMFYLMKSSNLYFYSVSMYFFLVILVGGLINEWYQGMINWMT
uniref:NADH-ubiquinone oxidoreductase chain 3 n=1 Tax=Stenopsyche angustata TaxID=1560148 RepID=A0A7L8XGK3_9NEOP|nr:NADH dehydrogenase subunit 3 [Stenopsyche angustata]QOH91245.1 NADH dehydrogenase subunit 3 [Stenopsyche angustata]